jgi:hypothetical protein
MSRRASSARHGCMNRLSPWRGKKFRQFFILDLGHDEPTILLANDRHSSAPKLITRYAQRMLIENALSDAVRFFRRAHLPIVLASGLLDAPVTVLWWNEMRLRLTA